MTQKKFRTAVLVVHGMGSQRPLETVRGVIDAVWRDGQPIGATSRRVWTHPEPSGTDIDLTVMTTSALSGKPGDRVADFHELYWAHLMSETRAAAVLLWLFELGRKGPRFSNAMNALWFVGAIFLCMLINSAALIAIKVVVWFCDLLNAPEWLLFTPLIMLAIASAMSLAAALYYRACRLASTLLVVTALIALVFAAFAKGPGVTFPPTDVLSQSQWWANVLLPMLVSTIVIMFVMGKWGFRAQILAYALSWLFVIIYLYLPADIRQFTAPGADKAVADNFHLLTEGGRYPWSLKSGASMVAAWIFIGVYLAVYAAFLQPYLGDAARYFRNSPANISVRREIRKQAVDTLDQLHRLRLYDRIIVVAHSLGTVVAYDMLRAYYSRVCDRVIFEPNMLQPEFDIVDKGNISPAELRDKGRTIIAKMAGNIAKVDNLIPAGQPPEAWLVTDFVTLGSPLTHARYLMCNGDSFKELDNDFNRRLLEREFPSCPPTNVAGDPDGWLAFTNPRTGKTKLHHGGLFALTRWTNLYFPMSQVFWGDAIGGPVAVERNGTTVRPLFGTHIKDEKVYLDRPDRADFFTHTAYWALSPNKGRSGPQIDALIRAINLEDRLEGDPAGNKDSHPGI